MATERITVTLTAYINGALEKAAEEDGISNSARAARFLEFALGIRELINTESPITTKTGRIVADEDGTWKPSKELLTKP